MKKILFVHNNFPAQFLHISRALAGHPDVQLAAIGSNSARPVPGVKLLKYGLPGADVSMTHPFARRFDLECRRAEQVLYAASNLINSDFKPDIVMAHPGWGETLPLRSMFPKSKLIVYCEYFYRSEGGDLGFDMEFPQSGVDGHVRLHLKNASTLLALAECDMALSPTEWQRSTYPVGMQDKIKVVHEGVDTEVAKPMPNAEFQLSPGRTLTASDEVVTFVARAFEPLRGCHIFMRSLPRILAARPHAQVVIIGGKANPYGLSAPQDTTWKEVFFNEIASKVDQSRIHFVGHAPHDKYLNALRVSSAHVYLTYPFVLSWSMLEAMSAECLVIGSDTPPVREVIDGSNGLLVPFFEPDTLAKTVIEALAHPERFKKHRARARKTILENYDTEKVCVPRLTELLDLGVSKTRARRKRAAATRT
jgi:glycosyltransferase involved in cell wall biosynthesis